jgi:sugar lactone lactonase YvrE
MIAKKYVSLIALGACLVGLSAFGGQKKPVERPYKSRGAFTTVVNLTDGSYETTATAKSTHLGLTALHATGLMDLTTFTPITQQGTGTAANGDQVYLKLVSGVVRITGGTGRFEGATGSIGVVEIEDFKTTIKGDTMTATYTATVEGTITYGSLAQKEIFVQGPLVGGQAFHYANGINMDAAGRLYVASTIGREIVILNREDGAFIDRLGAAQGVLGPDDCTFGPDGSVYWTDLGYGEVGRLAPDGTVTKQFVAPGVNPITFSADGRLFVGLAFLGDGLWELDPNLELPPTEIINAPGQLNAFAFGPDGKLYSPANALGALVRIDVDAKTITQVAPLGTIAAVKFDAAGKLWVLSVTQGALLRVDRESGAIEQSIPVPGGLDNFVPGPGDRFYVSSSDGILEVSSDGAIRVLQPGGLMNPGGVAVARVGDQEVVVVADLFDLKAFDAATGTLRADYTWTATGVSPMTVSASAAGVVISGWLLQYGPPVLEWDLVNGLPLRQAAVPNVPLNAIEFQGKLVVAELVTGSVAEFVGDQRTVLAEGLLVPTGLAASADNLYVADWGSGLIHQVVAAGVKLNPTRIIAAGLRQPEGMALDRHGNLLVVETGTRSLVRVDVQTGAIATVVMGLAVGAPADPGMPPTWIFDGVTVAPSGTIYVSSYGENAIYRIKE